MAVRNYEGQGINDSTSKFSGKLWITTDLQRYYYYY